MKIKVCGMRDAANIREVEQLDVDWIGFVFYPPSPRYVSDDSVTRAAIQHCLKPKAGVFVNAEPEETATTAEHYGLNIIQLHGAETPETCKRLRERGYTVIKAFSVATVDDLEPTVAYEHCADYFLFDTKCAGFGGSGRRFDWSVLYNYQRITPFILSGGLNPDSLDALLQFSHPKWAGIDLNSGFETAPAMKNTKKLELFIKKFKQQQ